MHPTHWLICAQAQIATNQISEGVAACVLAEEAGAAWVDLNCGCPIYEATRRGLGSALLRKPAKLARLVGGLVEGSPLPVSVKIRLSPAGNKDVNALEHIEALAALDPVWKSTCVSGAPIILHYVISRRPPSSGEESASPRHRAGVASMA